MKFLINLFKVLVNLDILVESIDRAKLFKAKKKRKKRNLRDEVKGELDKALASVNIGKKVDIRGYNSMELQDKAAELLS